MQCEKVSVGSTFFRMNNSSPNLISINSESTSRKSDHLILVFGSEPETCFLYRTILELWDFRVEQTDNIEDSLAVIADKRPDLILMDCVLSFEKNLEAIRRLRENMFPSEIPIVLTSGFAQPQFRSFALFNGADELLVKPLNYDSLRFCLEKNIRKYVEKTARGED